MSNKTAAEQSQNLEDYVTVDHACVTVMPLLVSQLEIANQQLADGVNTLIEGFMQLSRTLNEVDTNTFGSSFPDSINQRVQRIHRFTDDLIQVSERMHLTTVTEATKEENKGIRQNMNKIVMRTLDLQQLASEIRKEAVDVVEELEIGSEALMDNPDMTAGDAKLLKTFLGLQAEINKMIVAFQFQDRVSQIMTAVINASKDLIDYINEARAQNHDVDNVIFVNLSEMIQRVESYYVSKEQYELTGDHKDDTSDDIELF